MAMLENKGLKFKSFLMGRVLSLDRFAKEMGVVYILLIDVRKDLKLRIGALGEYMFRKGIYCYVGTAQRNFGLRIIRHLSRRKRKFWHIDYLLSSRHVEIGAILWKRAGRAEECRIARKLAKMGTPIKGFGCSDCKCISHLFLLS